MPSPAAPCPSSSPSTTSFSSSSSSRRTPAPQIQCKEESFGDAGAGAGDDDGKKSELALSGGDWRRAYLVACGAGLVADPLFLYAVSVSAPLMCVFLDGWLAATVTALRCVVDAAHAAHFFMRLRHRRRRRCAGDVEAVDGDGDGCRSPALCLDLFILLPLLQGAVWILAPALLRRGSPASATTAILIVFLVEYLPKLYHAASFLRRAQIISFGTTRWGIAVNLTVYFVAAHAVGACWYLLGAQRAAKCLADHHAALPCSDPVYYGAAAASAGVSTGNRTAARSVCLAAGGDSAAAIYGAYKMTAGLVANPSRLEKILLPIFWGLMTLSTFGNLESTTEWTEIVFNIVTITGGLVLVTMLIGNIKVFLPVTASKKHAMQLRLRSVEWWMKRKRLPARVRQRVREFERQRWAATRGVDELEMIRDLPEGLRRDIKYHLCLDLVRQVPLFQHMDTLVLENICDRVKSLIFPKGEIIVREGDPVQRMLFIVRGHLQSSQLLRNGVESSCTLGPGNFSGDELLSWCLRRPFHDRLPPASATLAALESTEAFGLDAGDVKYVTQHFRYTFANERVRRSARYYSPGWRTWAAVAVQLAWRRYRRRKTLSSLSFIRPRRPLSRCNSAGEEKLRLYAALLTSPKPDHDDFFD